MSVHGNIPMLFRLRHRYSLDTAWRVCKLASFFLLITWKIGAQRGSCKESIGLASVPESFLKLALRIRNLFTNAVI